MMVENRTNVYQFIVDKNLCKAYTNNQLLKEFFFL